MDETRVCFSSYFVDWMCQKCVENFGWKMTLKTMQMCCFLATLTKICKVKTTNAPKWINQWCTLTWQPEKNVCEVCGRQLCKNASIQQPTLFFQKRFQIWSPRYFPLALCKKDALSLFTMDVLKQADEWTWSQGMLPDNRKTGGESTARRWR